MSNLARIAITGASGRMGRMLIETIEQSDKAEVIGAVERPGHDWIGQDLGLCLGGAETGVTVTDDAATAFAAADVVIDFTAPAATVASKG